MKVHLKTLGCRLNQAEIDRMARQFMRRGDQITEQADEADLIVVNTCAVTQEATRSSRQLIYRLNRSNPQAEIAVTGCYAHIAPEEIRVLPGVAHVVDNYAKESLVSVVTGEPVAPLEAFDAEPIARDALIGAGGRTRAFLKVQDGCDRHCTFCVTRVARGAGRSRAVAEIIEEARGLYEAGYREAVLTGVHLGSYGHDLGQPDGLLHLLQALLNETDFPRLRLSSLEPWGIPPNFFRLWQNPRLCRHLHLPLQSGCDATLRRMVRRTTQAQFRAIVAEARGDIPDVAVATDLIVGFPGETDMEFGISRDFVEEMQFSAIHAFRYSPRPGTAAEKLPNHVSEAEKKARMEVIQTIAERSALAFAEAQTGKVRPVLWEAISGAEESGYINNGYTDNYLRVRVVTPEILTNSHTQTHLIGYDPTSGSMKGALDL
ncbi:MAG: tRNA (N(6)-L-threonylcarbamoyladenosine(37)-C(2))-methylthiotransferase MtaB [Anaerolineae bacterium]